MNTVLVSGSVWHNVTCLACCNHIPRNYFRSEYIPRPAIRRILQYHSFRCRMALELLFLGAPLSIYLTALWLYHIAWWLFIILVLRNKVFSTKPRGVSNSAWDATVKWLQSKVAPHNPQGVKVWCATNCEKVSDWPPQFFNNYRNAIFTSLVKITKPFNHSLRAELRVVG
jgi:hypothetical protein